MHTSKPVISYSMLWTEMAGKTRKSNNSVMASKRFKHTKALSRFTSEVNINQISIAVYL